MKRIGLVLFISGFWLLVSGFYTFVFAQDEALILTTYYPAPYGNYNYLVAHSPAGLLTNQTNTFMRIGVDTIPATNYVPGFLEVGGACSDTSGGRMGIYSSINKEAAGNRYAIRASTTTTKNVDGNIYGVYSTASGTFGTGNAIGGYFTADAGAGGVGKGVYAEGDEYGVHAYMDGGGVTTAAIYAQSAHALAIDADSTDYLCIRANNNSSSSPCVQINGITSSSQTSGVLEVSNTGTTINATAIHSISTDGYGIYAESTNYRGARFDGGEGAVQAFVNTVNKTSGWAIWALCKDMPGYMSPPDNTKIGIFSEGQDYAGYFVGNVEITGRTTLKIPNIPVFDSNSARDSAIQPPQNGDLCWNKAAGGTINGRLQIYLTGIGWQNEY